MTINYDYYGSFDADGYLLTVTKVNGELSTRSLGTVRLLNWETRPPRPSPFHKMMQSGGNVYWVDPRDTEVAKANKRSEINEARWAANQSTFTFQGKTIACDALSRSDIDAVANTIALTGGFPANFPMTWKAVDNTYVSLPDVDTFKQFYLAMVNQGTQNFIKSESLKAQVAATANKEDLVNIKW